MQPARAFFSAMIKAATAALLLFFVALILNGFPDYFPPRFDRGFLQGRQDYFYSSGYAVGFYAHIVSSPLVVVLGIVQLSSSLRNRFPRLHRRCGRIYAVLILLAMAPGGLVLAQRTFAGLPAVWGFAILCGLLWATTLNAWRLAVRKRFAQHRRWMLRSYVLVTSAIVLRLVHYGLSAWSLSRSLHYTLAVWLSWGVPLLVLEVWLWHARRRETTIPSGTP